ncbi:MAG: hypothetical protein ACOYW7_05210 [Nitrospirota bacterium]
MKIFSNRLPAMMKKMWIYTPSKMPKPKVPDRIRDEVQAKADHLIESEFNRAHIKHPKKDEQFSYIVDIYAKWYRNYFHFIAKYRCPALDCISEFFERKFVRLEYIGNNRFTLSYMRHTGQWWELYTDLTLEQCLEAIRDEPHFLP